MHDGSVRKSQKGNKPRTLAGASSRHSPGGEAVQGEGTDGVADEPQGGMPDGGRHLPHLAVAPLGEPQGDPGVGHVLADADGRIPRREPRAFRNGSARAGKVRLPSMTRPRAGRPGRGIGDALHLHPVDLLQAGGRRGEPVHEGPVVGEQQQAFAVPIQPPGRVDPGHGDEVLEAGAAPGVREWQSTP